MRQLAQKTDGIGEKDALLVRQSKASSCRVERREEFVFREHPGAGKEVEQGGLAGIGVTNHCGNWPLISLPALTLDGPVFPYLFKIAFEPRNPLLDPPAIDL